VSVGLEFQMHAERTPNPHSIKWVLGELLAPSGVTAEFPAPVSREVSPLAARLFAVPGVVGIFLASNFVTVTKTEDADWEELGQPLIDAIVEFAGSGEKALGPEFVPAGPTGDEPVVARIRQILEDEVRPAVAMDGGDVSFIRFRDGVVEVQLQGACVGCPSSTATLRFGIEGRLREAIPEVQKVVSV
jgi:Fe-S cluster biogenesis protein NfuA